MSSISGTVEAADASSQLAPSSPTSPPLASPRVDAATTHHLTIEGKLIVVGDSFCGKTSIITAFARGELNPATRPSIGVAYSKKSITVPGATVNFQIWDTAGQERYRSINSLYYRNAAAAVIVFDLTKRTSFDNVSVWLEEIRKNGAQNMILLLAGNKVDLKPAREVPYEMAKEFADSNKMLYIETSAKTGAGITDIFKLIAKEAPRAIQASVSTAATKSSSAEGFRILSYDRAVVDVAADEKGKGDAGSGSKGCC